MDEAKRKEAGPGSKAEIKKIQKQAKTNAEKDNDKHCTEEAGCPFWVQQ